MNDLVKSFYDRDKDIWGEPQTYCGINFFPLKLKGDTESKSIFYSIFQVPKRYIKDKYIEGISYLRFLIQVNQYALNPSGKEVQEKIVKFLENITNKKVEFKTDAPDNLTGLYIASYIKIIIDNVEFDENDFDVIREIILLQNGSSSEFVESYLPDLEQKLFDANSAYDNLTIEEEIFKFCSMMGILVSEIKDYTLFQFNYHFKEEAILFQHNAYMPMEIMRLTNQLEQKNKEIVKPFLMHTPDKGRYGSILIPWANASQSKENPGIKRIDGEYEETFEDFKKLFNK